MSYDEFTAEISPKFLNALINGETEELSRRERKQLDQWEDSFRTHSTENIVFSCEDDDAHFSSCDITGEDDNVVEVLVTVFYKEKE